MKPILNSLALLFITVAVSVANDKTVIRVGHFPNITHAQGLVAHYLSRQGKGWFESRLGPDVEIQWFTYNAGPSAMEAVLVSSVKFLNEKRDLAKKFWEAHKELTDWILKNPEEAQKIVKSELLAETRSDISAELIAHALLADKIVFAPWERSLHRRWGTGRA